MAQQKRTLDVWIVESNTIYREVPFTVVSDWIQQGRLLIDDKVSIAGTEKWAELGRVTAFQPYFPKPEPEPVDDAAATLEPVALDFAWKGRASAEDEDVDMVPLIDISLVLLIFFMMTAALSTGVLSPINTPRAKYQLAAIEKDMYWVGIDNKDNLGNVKNDASGWPLPYYSVGKGDTTFSMPGGGSRDFTAIQQILRTKFKDHKGAIPVRIRADRGLPVRVIRETTADLQKLQAQINQERGGQRRIELTITGEVSEPKE